MTVIDADGHVMESQAMFDLLEKDYYPRRPLPVSFNGHTDTAYRLHNGFWLIDGQIYPKLVGRAPTILGTPTIMEWAKAKKIGIPAQELTDIEARFRDLDAMKIDTQVVYPTLFLTTTAEDVELEGALLRCYNSFLGEVCSKTEGRIRFAALVPIRDVAESIGELGRAKKLGAVSVMIHGVAWDRSLGDRSLFPFYEEAARLDMPVAVHFGWGSPALHHAIAHPYNGDALRDIRSINFNNAALPVLMGFYHIMTSGVLETFRSLRMAFLEVGSHWLPYLLHQLRRSTLVARDPAHYFKEGWTYAACEADEDINYIASWIGEDSLVVASDYPHTDPSHEEQLVDAIMEREDLSLRVKEKMLSQNPAKLYGM